MNYLEKIQKLITDAVTYQDELDDFEERIVLAQYPRRYRPGADPEASDTSEEIQSHLEEIIYIEKKTIASVMLELGYQVMEHEITGPVWGMAIAPAGETPELIADKAE